MDKIGLFENYYYRIGMRKNIAEQKQMFIVIVK